MDGWNGTEEGRMWSQVWIMCVFRCDECSQDWTRESLGKMSVETTDEREREREKMPESNFLQKKLEATAVGEHEMMR